MEKDGQFWAAVKTADTAKLDYLIHNSAIDINETTVVEGITAQHYCAKIGNVDLLKYLIQQGALLDTVDHYKDNVLHYACRYDSVGVVDFLLENETHKSLLLNMAGKLERTPLYDAIETVNVELITKLLTAGAKVGIKDSGGITPLICIISTIIDKVEQERLIKQMLTSSKEVTIFQISDYLKSHPNEQFLHELLLEIVRNQLTRAESYNLILKCARSSKRHILTKFPDLNVLYDDDGSAAIHTLCFSDNSSAVSLLLQLGALPDVQDVNGWTPYHIVIYKKFWTTFNILLEYGGDINRQTTRNFQEVIAGTTPIMLFRYSQMNAVRISQLRSKGADLKLQNNHGNNALHALLKVSQTLCAETIEGIVRRAPKDVLDMLNRTGYSALHVAVIKQSIPVVNVLLRNGCNVNILTKGNVLGPTVTPLHLAVQRNSSPFMLKALISWGADVSLKTSDERTALDLCMNSSGGCDKERLGLIPRLVRAGGVIESLKLEDWIEVFSLYIKLARLLIESGSRIYKGNAINLNERDQMIAAKIENKLSEPLMLMRLAANKVRQVLRPNTVYAAQFLPIPKVLHGYLALNYIDVGMPEAAFTNFFQYYHNDY